MNCRRALIAVALLATSSIGLAGCESVVLLSMVALSPTKRTDKGHVCHDHKDSICQIALSLREDFEHPTQALKREGVAEPHDSAFSYNLTPVALKYLPAGSSMLTAGKILTAAGFTIVKPTDDKSENPLRRDEVVASVTIYGLSKTDWRISFGMRSEAGYMKIDHLHAQIFWVSL